MPRKKRTVTGQVESLNDWMARVDRQVEEAARKMEQKSSKSSPQGSSHRHRARPLRNVNIPVLVFDGGKLNPEQRQALERLIENSQKHVVQWAVTVIVFVKWRRSRRG